MFDFLFSIFKPTRRLNNIINPSNICKECGNKYNDPDSAVVCADWDVVLGVQRHQTFKGKL